MTTPTTRRPSDRYVTDALIASIPGSLLLEERWEPTWWTQVPLDADNGPARLAIGVAGGWAIVIRDHLDVRIGKRRGETIDVARARIGQHLRNMADAGWTALTIGMCAATLRRLAVDGHLDPRLRRTMFGLHGYAAYALMDRVRDVLIGEAWMPVTLVDAHHVDWDIVLDAAKPHVAQLLDEVDQGGF